MAKRKTFAESMTPEEAAFLETGKAVANHGAGIDPAPQEKAGSGAAEELHQFILPPIPLSKDAGLSVLNVRIEHSLVAALQRASVMRKLRKEEPFHQSRMVEAALRPYLKKLGYYDGA
jgi:hypothetical protein